MPPIPAGTRRVKFALDELEQCIDNVSAADMERLEKLTTYLLEQRAAWIAQMAGAWSGLSDVIFEDDA